jgi:DNA gyrase subunit A
MRISSKGGIMEDKNIGTLEQVDITNETKKAYLDYAMSVIVQRALPDIRDGLKPVHRRILYAMYKDLGLVHTHKYSKCAGIVGEVLKNYHPHGDTAVYDSLVRLAQQWSMRYPLVDGQGNFGSIDGDRPAAYRYTEARLMQMAEEMMFDYDKETIDFGPNFDGVTLEPLVLPAKLPNLLLMGSEGIAVGMATKIPPHNLGEVVDAITFTIDHTTHKEIQDIPELTSADGSVQEPEGPTIITNSDQEAKVTEDNSPVVLASDVTVDQLLEFVKGPDFPTAGAIYDWEEIRNVYKTGRGRVIMRGIAEIEDIGQGKSAIIISELPYQVNKAVLVAKIAELAKDKRIDGITDLRDESDRQGIRVVIELKRDTSPKKVLNNLFKNTALQSSFPANFVALVDGIPRTVNLKTIIDEYIKHRFSVVTRRSEFELKQARARIHILDGLKIAVSNIDEVVHIIRSSKNTDDARERLMERFKLSEIQTNAILDMQLRRLSALEIDKLEEEWRMVKETIDYLEGLLSNPTQILSVVKDEILKIREKYNDSRRTKVYKSKVGEFSDEDLIQNEPTVITITESGYIKRQSLTSFKTQGRGGKGIKGMSTKEGDVIEHILYAQTHDHILFFTNLGKVYQTRVFEIGEGSRVGKGQAIVNVIDITSNETIQSVLTYNPKDSEGKNFIVMATQKGEVKKTKVEQFTNIRKSGIIAIKLNKDDSLSWVRRTGGKDDVVLVTRNGKIIAFSEEQIRSTGRSSMGVRGIKLVGDDEVVGMDVVTDPEKKILIITENGIGKKSKVAQVRNQNRGGQGVKIANINTKTGKIVLASVTDEQDCKEIIITSTNGQIVKIPFDSVPTLSREAQGVILMRFTKTSDKVASATCINEEEA